MRYSIRKKDLDLLVKNMKKLLTIGDGIIISGNIMHPVPLEVKEDELTVNGNTSVRTLLPFSLADDTTMITVMNISDVLGFLAVKKNLKIIEVVVDDYSIRIRIDDEEIVIATTNKEFNGKSMTKDYRQFESLLKIATLDDNDNVIVKALTKNELSDIRDSKPVTLESPYGKVRISRNLFTLTGPMRSTGEVPFTANWAVHQVILPDNTIDHVLVLHVNYKEMEAVHMYAVTPF